MEKKKLNNEERREKYVLLQFAPISVAFTYEPRIRRGELSDGFVLSSSLYYYFLRKPFNMYQQTTLRTEQQKLIFIKEKLAFLMNMVKPI